MGIEDSKLHLKDIYEDEAVFDFIGRSGLGISLRDQDDSLYADLSKESTIALYEYMKKNMEELGWL